MGNSKIVLTTADLITIFYFIFNFANYEVHMELLDCKFQLVLGII